MSPQVSVIVPVHNRAACLEAAIDSALAQDLNVEIIIVDDGSTDSSPALIKQLALKHREIKYCLLENNRGGGVARNVGIDLAQSEWIAFLDSDDVWLAGKLPAQFEVLKSHPGKNKLCFTNLLVDLYDGSEASPWNTEPFEPSTSAKAYMLTTHQVIQTSTIVINTEAARRVRFDERLRRHQDIDFVIRAEMGGVRFLYLDKCLVRYCADPRAVRVSKRVGSGPSLEWLEIAREYLTRKELDAFYLRNVFDMHFKDAPLGALIRSVQVAGAGNQSIAQFLVGLARQITPHWIKRLRRVMIAFVSRE